MLDQLYYFTEVYRNASISRAADFLHISRQALSHSIKSLEHELGVELFVRQKDGVTPTKAADALYESAQNVLHEEAVIRKKMLTFSQDSGNIHQYTINAPQSYVHYYGEDLVTQLSQAFPQVMFVLSTIKNSDDISISQKDINIQIKINKQSRKSMQVPVDYQCVELKRLPMYIWVHRSNPLAMEKNNTYTMLRPYPLSVLKNTLNGLEFAKMLNLGYDPLVEVPSNLKGNIKRFGHYSIDVKMLKGHLLLEKDFKDDPELVSVKTLESIYVYVIYKKNIEEEIIDYIARSVKKSFEK